MEAFWRPDCRADPEILVEAGVEESWQNLRRNPIGEIDMGHLGDGVNTGIGSAGSHHHDALTVREFLEGPLQLSLNRSDAVLALPAGKAGAEIGHGDLCANNHPKYPRTSAATVE